MIAIYRGEDTDFAGAEPIKIKIDTDLDLTGYTAELYFGSIIKSFESKDVEKKVLPLSYTAAETSTFFPGRGYATVKVYDTEGRTAVLKRFIVDVRFRKCDEHHLDAIDIAESVQEFINVRKAVDKMFLLDEDDDTEAVKKTINAVISAARERTEFSPIPDFLLSEIGPNSIAIFNECMKKLQALVLNIDSLGEDADMEEVKETVNAILSVLGNIGKRGIDDIDFSGLTDPSSSVLSIRNWAVELNKLLKKIQK